MWILVTFHLQHLFGCKKKREWRTWESNPWPPACANHDDEVILGVRDQNSFYHDYHYLFVKYKKKEFIVYHFSSLFSGKPYETKKEKKVDIVGIEPTTSCMRSRRSTPELNTRLVIFYARKSVYIPECAGGIEKNS